MTVVLKEILPVESCFRDYYASMVDFGKQHLKNKKIVFSIITRNTAGRIKKNIESLIETVSSQHIKDYAVIVYENDSTDGTKDILSSMAKKDSKIHIRLEDLNRVQYGPVKDLDRATRLAEYRSENQKLIKEKFYDFDYTIVVDSDFVEFSRDGVYNSFGFFDQHPTMIDAIAGNAFQIKTYPNGQKSLWNYDSWAFRDSWWDDLDLDPIPQVPQRMLWFGFWIPPVGSPIKKVNSAFGGMAIYKTGLYVEGVYGAKSYTGRLDLDHAVLHYSLHQQKKDFFLGLNPSQIMLMPD